MSRNLPWLSKPTDHFECPKWVLSTLLPCLRRLSARPLIYNPFYCTGAIVKRWAELQVDCSNPKEDFESTRVGGDVLSRTIVTCPPTSWIHKLLHNILPAFKRWAILVPVDCADAHFHNIRQSQSILLKRKVKFVLDGDMGLTYLFQDYTQQTAWVILLWGKAEPLREQNWQTKHRQFQTVREPLMRTLWHQDGGSLVMIGCIYFSKR